MKEQLGISASNEELLGYFTQPSYEEARLAWKELMVKWNQEKDPEVAKDITQDLAEVTAKTVAEKMDVKSPTIIEKAYKADKPDSPSLKKNVLIGAVLGFILMAAAIVIQYLMNDTILKEEDIEKYLGINTLAQLPLVKGTTKRTKKVKRARE